MSFGEHCPSEAQQDPHEVWENYALLFNAQSERVVAERLRDETIRLAKENNQPVDLRHIIYWPPDEIVPMGTDTVIEVPRPNEELWGGVQRLIFRYPSPQDPHCPPAPENEWWNDVFILVEREDGIAEHYLLNSQGMFAYDSAADVVRQPQELAEDEHNLFTVHHQAYQANPVSAADLNKMIPQCRIAQQTSRDI